MINRFVVIRRANRRRVVSRQSTLGTSANGTMLEGSSGPFLDCQWETQMPDLFALWLFTFGMWPLADPGHWPLSLLVVLDWTLHIGGACFLLSRWTLTVSRRAGGDSDA